MCLTSAVGGITRVSFPASALPDHAHAGQFVWLHAPAASLLEFHPFTLSSAPADPVRTLHIKDMGAGTFTGALARLPAQALALASRQGLDGGNAGSDASGADVGLAAVGQRGLECDIDVAIDGPYGAPLVMAAAAESGARTLILVAGGVGITPCISILVDLFARARALNHHPRGGADAVPRGDDRRRFSDANADLAAARSDAAIGGSSSSGSGTSGSGSISGSACGEATDAALTFVDARNRPVSAAGLAAHRAKVERAEARTRAAATDRIGTGASDGADDGDDENENEDDEDADVIEAMQGAARKPSYGAADDASAGVKLRLSSLSSTSSASSLSSSLDDALLSGASSDASSSVPLPLPGAISSSAAAPTGIGALRRIVLVWCVRDIRTCAAFADALHACARLHAFAAFDLHLHVRSNFMLSFRFVALSPPQLHCAVALETVRILIHCQIMQRNHRIL